VPKHNHNNIDRVRERGKFITKIKQRTFHTQYLQINNTYQVEHTLNVQPTIYTVIESRPRDPSEYAEDSDEIQNTGKSLLKQCSELRHSYMDGISIVPLGEQCSYGDAIESLNNGYGSLCKVLVLEYEVSSADEKS
jgi:hypothetical protein